MRFSGRLATLMLTGLALAGCAREPDIRVPPRYAKYARLVPPDRIITLSDDARIPLRIWPAQGVEKGAILALHGFNDSRDAWEATAPSFAQAGFSVWAPDLRGFGSAPERGGWVGTDRLVEDVREELNLLATERPGRPVWLMGESMGGAVAMIAASETSTLPLSGVVLLAPAVWKIGPFGKASAHFLAAIDPDGRVSGRELPVHVVASDNIAALRRLYFDPLTLHVTKFGALRGLVDLMAQAAHAASRQMFPTLVIYGDHDQLVPAQAMTEAWRRFPSSVRRDLIPGGHHLLLRDRAGHRVMEDILSWLQQPDTLLPSGGDVSAGVWSAENGGQQGVNAPFGLLPAQVDRLSLP
ncbi:MAG: alpha/beta fold hydrolase [Acetobacter aceti]|nr:alpha/beta fold hydrolase [Acetobacter aceti]